MSSASPLCTDLLSKPSVRHLLTCLQKGGIEGRLVGGCVRDALLGRSSADIDIAVNASPDVVCPLLEEAGLKVIPTGLKHGTVTVLVGGEAFEVTSLRHDVTTDGRHATVAYTTDWREDAARRDFTMNALYLRADGQVDDFFNGRVDLARGIVRFIGDPDARIREDFLRILRYYRFAQRFAEIEQGTLDEASHAAVQRHRRSLTTLSKERIQSELFKILAHPKPAAVVHLMNSDGIFQALLGRSAEDGEVFDRLIRLQDAFPIPEELRVLERLFLLFPCDEAFYAATFRLSRHQLNLLSRLFCVQERPLTQQELFLLRHKEGDNVARMKVDVSLARTPQATSTMEIFYQRLSVFQPPFPVKGADLVQLGLLPGEHVGELLRKVEAFWLAHEGAVDKEACLTFAQNILETEKV